MEILIENKPVRDEFTRWCEYFGVDDSYDTNVTVGLLAEGAKHYLLNEKKHGLPVAKQTWQYLGIEHS